jgi:hypothetical protein
MEYYKELYYKETIWGRKAAGAMGRAQGHLIMADAMLANIDAYSDPEHLEKQIKRIRKLIHEADKSLTIL